jgi:threonine-phosphate decarboxylase
MTKCCAIPGLRLGFVVASEALASELRKFQQPWSVNALAQEAGTFLLKEKTAFDAKRIRQLSFNLQHEINQIEGFRVLRSEAPFFLIEIKSGTATQLKRFLIDEHGILIRDASNFEGLNPQFFRICTRDETDNLLLINGLNSFKKQFTKVKA